MRDAHQSIDFHRHSRLRHHGLRPLPDQGRLASPGLVLYCVGTVAQLLLLDSFDAIFFKLWYWSGALAVAPWLGQGTVFLLIRKGNRAWISFWAVLAFSVIGLLVIWMADVDTAVYQPGVDLTEQYQDIFTAIGSEKAVRTVLAIVMNTYGTALLVGGAVYSAFIFWRKRVLPHRMWGNILIAIGGLLPAMSGALILLGSPAYLKAGLLLGAILLFTGFLVTTRGTLILEKRPTQPEGKYSATNIEY